MVLHIGLPRVCCSVDGLILLEMLLSGGELLLLLLLLVVGVVLDDVDSLWGPNVGRSGTGVSSHSNLRAGMEPRGAEMSGGGKD